MKERPKVGEILVKAGVIDELQLRAALGDQANWGGRLGVALVKMGLIEERDLVRALAQQLEVPVVQLDGKRVHQDVLDLVSGDLAEKHMCVPLFIKEQHGVKTLFIGMDDPSNLAAVDDISFRTGLRVMPVLVSPSELCEAIDRFYHRGNRHPDAQPAVEPRNALSIDGSVGRGAAAARGTGAPRTFRTSADPGDGVQESLFREVRSLAEPEDEDPPIPGDFGPLQGGVGMSASARVAAATDAREKTAATNGDPTRTILRAVCQLLIENKVISADELRSRVRKLEGE